MASIDWTDVTGIAAELSTVSVEGQTTILDYVNEALDPDNFGGEDSAELKLARIYLAAHHGTISKRKGNTAAAAKKVGPLSLSYFAASESMQQTSYGRDFAKMVKKTVARLPLVV